MLEINSPQNTRIKRVGKLRTARGRRRQERVLIEGARELRRAVEAGLVIEELYCRQSMLGAGELPTDVAACLETLADVEATTLISVPNSIWKKLVVRGEDVELLGVGRRPQRALVDLKLPQNPLVLVIENVEKPGNLGAMIRTADAAGVDAVLLADCNCDWLNPNAIRASLGAVFTLPIVAGSNDEILEVLTAANIQPLAAVVDAEADFWSASCAAPTAVVVGSEADGLSDFWKSKSHAVRLPMNGVVDSLNVSVTAAVMLYEAVRQRTVSGQQAVSGSLD